MSMLKIEKAEQFVINNLFALRVSGESMIGAGIMDGDFVIVDRRDYAENGDIGVYLNNAEVAVVNGEAGDDVSFKGAEIALGNGVYDVIIKLQKTYIGAKKN